MAADLGRINADATKGAEKVPAPAGWASVSKRKDLIVGGPTVAAWPGVFDLGINDPRWDVANTPMLQQLLLGRLALLLLVLIVQRLLRPPIVTANELSHKTKWLLRFLSVSQPMESRLEDELCSIC